VVAICRTKVGHQQIQRHNEMALSPPYELTNAIDRRSRRISPSCRGYALDSTLRISFSIRRAHVARAYSPQAGHDRAVSGLINLRAGLQWKDAISSRRWTSCSSQLTRRKARPSSAWSQYVRGARNGHRTGGNESRRCQVGNESNRCQDVRGATNGHRTVGNESRWCQVGHESDGCQDARGARSGNWPVGG
jgi:hypothetical protein